MKTRAQEEEIIGTVLDRRYRIERLIGEGGMGLVYLGEHVRTGRKCAVKLLPPEALGDVAAVQRFEREARVLGGLGHPGIVGVHDFSETADGRPFFVMDYLKGEDLAERLARVGTLDWESTKKVVDEISAALWAAHQAGVLHRDRSGPPTRPESCTGISSRATCFWRSPPPHRSGWCCWTLVWQRGASPTP